MKTMKSRATMLALCMLGASAVAQVDVPGTLKHISIDGIFTDWVGVPLAATAAQGPAGAVQYKDVYIANDDNYLYIRFTLYAAKDPFTSFNNIFVDADNDLATGFHPGGGGHVSSELLVQSGTGYQEKNGDFNEGAINGLDWAAAPSGSGTDFEARISRHATYASDNAAVFASDTISFVLEAENSSYVSVLWVPETGGFVYTFASPPPPPPPNVPLVTLATSTWRVNQSGTDLGTNWLDQAYDDTQAGWSGGPGLFGYTPLPNIDPAIQTPLSPGPNTYYFRTRFQWTNDVANVALVVTNYLSDGAVYYLNGIEVRRVRMPAGTVSYATVATGTNLPVARAEVFGFPTSALLTGENILEVEAHQAINSVADLVFGLSLTAASQFPVLLVDTNQPADQTVFAGSSATFSAEVLGSGPLSYQWFFNGTDAISGATNASYTIPQVLTNNAGLYQLTVSNSLGTATTRAALLTVSNVPAGIADVTQPADTFAVEGKPVTLIVVPAGTPVLSYQWFYGNSAIAGATEASYTIASPVLTNAGSYYVNVSNPAGSTNSRTATLTVLRDTIPPIISQVSAGATRMVVKFSELVDPVTAANADFYTLSGGLSVLNTTPNPDDNSEVILTASSGLNLGSVYTLSVNGVKDLFGNPAATSASFARGILIDGSFDDWTGLRPLYTSDAPSGNTGAADFKDIYVFNDANYYYFRVTLWADIDPASGQFPLYVNIFFDTDNNVATGFSSAIGSEMLVQSGFGYQEKNGGFNEGGIDGLDWLCLPAAPATNFECRVSRAASFSDSTPVFTSNVINLVFQGLNTGFATVNQAPASGVLSYTNVVGPSVPPLPLGKLALAQPANGKLAVIWDSPGTLQSSPALTGQPWTDLPSATSPYVVQISAAAQFFRLKR